MDLVKYEKAKARAIIRILTTYLNLDISGKKILEIGCSTGALMESLDKQGANVYGIDVESPWSKAYYYGENKRVICDLQDEDIPLKIPLNSFDLIIAQEVIEHIKKPYDFLSKIWKLLNTDGKLFLTTPNLNGITAVIKREKWCGTAIESHYLLYSVRSLDFLLHNCGFQRLKIFTNLIPIVYQGEYPWLRWLNRCFIPLGFGGGIMGLYRKISQTSNLGKNKT
jgi:2-polyprenyl-3-methyl-5-hydroxy-6-metoxy-1,4-benzoquinol methylase